VATQLAPAQAGLDEELDALRRDPVARLAHQPQDHLVLRLVGQDGAQGVGLRVEVTVGLTGIHFLISQQCSTADITVR
jgi:hypothetical protein